ncbi:MAG: ABC transporter ATP-binding protein/permease [Alphaproteobacteria bacterium]|nr:ABC transporter ATP-binding protein/permease [Alphaproteobacteria bacterium]
MDPETMDLARRQDVHVWRMLRPFLWPCQDPGLRTRMVVTLLLIGATSALGTLTPLVMAMVVDILATGGNTVAWLAYALLFTYCAVFTLNRVIETWRNYIYGPLEQRLNRRIRLAVLRHVHELSLRYHISRKTGQVSRIIDNGVRGMEQILNMMVFMILPLVVEVGIVVAVLKTKFMVSYTLVLFATAVIYSVVLVIGSEILRKHQRAAVTESAAAHGKAVDSLLNYETVKYFGNERYVADRYDDDLQRVERLQLKALYSRTMTGVLQVVIMGAGLTVMVLMAGREALAGTMTVGGFVLVNAYVMQVLAPLGRMGMLYRGLKQAFTDVEQMMGLLLETSEVADGADATPLSASGGAIAFRNVSFAYDVRRPILEDISFEVPAGTSMGLVGASGSGKTTIGRLLFRFYDPDTGSVEIDGADIRTATVASVRAAIGVVPQDAVLFNDTLLYNIAFGSPGASRGEIERAAKLAQLHDFVAALPDGYDTVVGERGLKLSGGEKQRVAIARAVLKRPRIYLFDEATSALDSHTERAIQDDLREVSRGTTTLIIAHRLSTVVHAAQILVLENGRIVERGMHDSLLRGGGRYAALWLQQQKRLELEAAD